MSSKTKIEFAVQMTCENCVDAVKNSFNDEKGAQVVDINLKTGSVVVETNLPTERVQQILEKTGKKVVVKGHAGQQAAVAILDTGAESVKGVVRFVQLPKTCIIDGTIDGLTPGPHNLAVHECGDLSEGCESVGKCYEPSYFADSSRKYGDLGVVQVDKNGRASFRVEDDVVRLPDLIGRSLVLSDSETQNRLVCGIIARSSGLFENPKTICACDGVSIWDERNTPRAAL